MDETQALLAPHCRRPLVWRLCRPCRFGCCRSNTGPPSPARVAAGPATQGPIAINPTLPVRIVVPVLVNSFGWVATERVGTTWSHRPPCLVLLRRVRAGTYVSGSSSRITIRATCGGLLMEELKLSMLKQDGHGGLRGLSHQSVIPYVNGEDYCIIVYDVVQVLS
jgi:hypothetical protein